MDNQTTSMLRLLRNRNFGLLWLAQTVSYVGDYFYFLAVPIIINRLTGSTLQIGLSVITFSLPQLFGFVSGVFVDRWNRRVTMIVADILRAGLVLTGFLVNDASQVWIFYVGGFLISAISIFFIPARDAIVPLLVSEDELVTANGLNQVTRTAAFLAGPALAGFTIGLFGDTVAWIVDCISYIVSGLLILGIARHAGRPSAPSPALASVGAVWEELRGGLTFLFGSRLYIGIMATASVAMLGIGAINVLWVPMMQRYHGVGPEGLGLIDSIQGAGMAVGGIITGWVASRWRLNWQIGVTSVVIGVMISLMGWSPIFWPILVFGFILGVALTPLNAVLTTAMQRGAPDHLRGRIMGGFNSVAGVSSLFSMGVAAFLGEVLNLRTLWIACGLLIAISGLLASRWIVDPAPYPAPSVSADPPP
jgi:MFS transporter, DHA3 family, macrolide efflux protein